MTAFISVEHLADQGEQYSKTKVEHGVDDLHALQLSGNGKPPWAYRTPGQSRGAEERKKDIVPFRVDAKGWTVLWNTTCKSNPSQRRLASSVRELCKLCHGNFACCSYSSTQLGWIQRGWRGPGERKLHCLEFELTSSSIQASKPNLPYFV